MDLDDEAEDDDDFLMKTVSLGKQVRVPGKLVRMVGLNPGDQVDATRFEVPVNSKLHVNKDGRVSVRRESITTDDAVDQVSVSIDNGKICFASK